MVEKLPPEIIVLGIDGLEYNLVEKWRLKNIMQKTYCKLDLSDYNIVVTPLIWGSMLTGVVDKRVMKIWEKAARITDLSEMFSVDIKQKWWSKLFFKLFSFLPFSIKNWINNNIINNMHGVNAFDLTANYVNDKKLKNIFQFFKNPWTNGIPGYGKNVCDHLKRKSMDKMLSGDEVSYKSNITKNYKKDKLELLSALNKQEYDFIFWYTSLLDEIGHLYISNEIYLLDYYLEINNVIGKVIDSYPNARIYIISDHGMKRTKVKWGLHSDHAFFSSNTKESIKKPIDIYNLILKNAHLK